MKRTSIYSTIGIILIIAILVLVNLIANTGFVRLDLTTGKVFSLSKASKSVVAGLEEPLTVKVFASRNLSPQLNDVKRFLNDLLAGYRSYGHGNFRYEFIDPATSEELEKEAQSYRVPPFQENVWNKDKLELKKVYLGAVFIYGDQQESIGVLQSASGLEYRITSLIKRLTSQQELTVGFLTGHGEASPYEQMTHVTGVLESNYMISTVDLENSDEISSDIDVLLVVHPTETVPEAHMLKLDQYIMNGGPVGWFVSTLEGDLQQGAATRISALDKLDEWTETYGFKIKQNLVADLSNAMINIQQRAGFFTIQNTINYPFFPMIKTFNEGHPVSSELKLITLFYPSTIDTSLAEIASVEITPIMYSSEKSLTRVGPRINVNALNEIRPEQFMKSGLVLGAALEGPFRSHFAEKGLPIDEEGNEIARREDLLLEAAEETRMLVVGDGLFLQDNYLASNPVNSFLVLNAVDWLVGDTELISLRSREISLRLLKELSVSQRDIWKYINWFLPPLMVIALGLIYWQATKRSRTVEI